MTGWRLKGSQEPLPAQGVRAAQMLGGAGTSDGSGLAGSNWLSGELPGLSGGGGSTIEWFSSGRLLRYVGVIRSKGDPGGLGSGLPARPAGSPYPWVQHEG